MIKTILSIRGSKVIHQDTGDVLALINWPIIDPDTGIIEAFWVKPTAFLVKDAILQASHIISFKKNLYVRSEEVIADPNEVIRIASILEQDRNFMGSEVQNEQGMSYGEVYDLSFSTDTYVLRQLFVRKRFFVFSFKKRIFPYERILQVLPEMIIVDDDSRKKEIIPEIPPEPAL